MSPRFGKNRLVKDVRIESISISAEQGKELSYESEVSYILESLFGNDSKRKTMKVSSEFVQSNISSIFRGERIMNIQNIDKIEPENQSEAQHYKFQKLENDITNQITSVLQHNNPKLLLDNNQSSVSWTAPFDPDDDQIKQIFRSNLSPYVDNYHIPDDVEICRHCIYGHKMMGLDGDNNRIDRNCVCDVGKRALGKIFKQKLDSYTECDIFKDTSVIVEDHSRNAEIIKNYKEIVFNMPRMYGKSNVKARFIL